MHRSFEVLSRTRHVRPVGSGGCKFRGASKRLVRLCLVSEPYDVLLGASSSGIIVALLRGIACLFLRMLSSSAFCRVYLRLLASGLLCVSLNSRLYLSLWSVCVPVSGIPMLLRTKK